MIASRVIFGVADNLRAVYTERQVNTGASSYLIHSVCLADGNTQIIKLSMVGAVSRKQLSAQVAYAA